MYLHHTNLQISEIDRPKKNMRDQEKKITNVHKSSTVSPGLGTEAIEPV